MKKGIIGRKIGMTQIFDEKGNVIPVTVIEAGPCVVAQVKTVETDGYDAIQLGFGEIKDKHINKPEKGHFAKSKLAAKKHLREFRLESIEGVKVGDEILLMATKKTFVVTEVGYFEPGEYLPTDELKAGEVGYIAAAIKTVSEARVGDTITLANNPADEPLPGYKKVTPMVYCGLYPIDGSEYENLKVNVDVKNVQNLKAVYPLAKKYGLEDRIFYTGIDIDFLEAVKKVFLTENK